MNSRKLVVVLLASACAVPPPPRAPSAPVTTSASVSLTQVGEDIVTRTNAQRRAQGLADLRRSNALMQAAQLQAEQMAARQQMAHDLSDVRYPGVADRLAAVGYAWRTYAENVAAGQRDAAAVVTGWMNSAGHRDNILSTRMTEMGAGFATDVKGQRYYVQVFGSPR